MRTRENVKGKARKSFDYACKQASRCRHEKCIKSCYACNEYKGCDIQERIERAREKMN